MSRGMGLKEKFKKAFDVTWIRASFIAAVVIITFVLGLGVIDAALYSNKIHRGVSVGGISVGGRTEESAVTAIAKLAKELEAKEVTVTYRNNEWVVTPEKLGASVDTKATAKKAFQIGRSGKTLKDIKARLNLWHKKKDLPPVYGYKQATLDTFRDEVAKGIDRPFEDAEIKIVDGKVVVTNSKNGKAVDKKRFQDGIVAAFSTTKKAGVTVPVETLKPNIYEGDLQKARTTVKQMVKAPVTLCYRQDSWQINEKQISDWIAFKKVRQGDIWNLEIEFDRDTATADIEKLTETITTPPKDAQFEIVEDEVKIIPSEKGIKVNIDAAIAGILEASQSSQNRQALLSTEVSEPKLTTEDAQKMGIKEKVSGYTTYFNASQTARVHNIKTLSRELDGIILAPDEVFSFNGNIGPRTASKGYTEAPAIVNGELVPALGGGICQVATTLFNSIFFGGYEVLERHNHSLFISHYPAGRDATVSYGGPDLKFKNDTGHYLLIKATATSSSLTINFYSTSRGVKVEYTTSAPYNYKPYPTKYEDDPTLPKGEKKVKDRGSQGRDVVVNRTILLDGKVVKKDKFTSKYKPQTAVVRVGTKEEDVSPEPETPQPPSQITNPQPPVTSQTTVEQ